MMLYLRVAFLVETAELMEQHAYVHCSSSDLKKFVFFFIYVDRKTKTAITTRHRLPLDPLKTNVL